MDDHSHKHFDPATIDKSRLDPLIETSQGFDWDEVERLLGEARELTEPDRERLAHVFLELLRWAVSTGPRTIYTKTVGLRLVALAWVLNPAMFDESPSGKELARRVGLCDAKFSREAVYASRTFHIRNRPQRHGGNFKPE